MGRTVLGGETPPRPPRAIDRSTLGNLLVPTALPPACPGHCIRRRLHRRGAGAGIAVLQSTFKRASRAAAALLGQASVWKALLTLMVLGPGTAQALAQPGLFDSDALPYGRSPINYFDEATANPVARLAAEIAAGRRKLQYEEGTGYLRSLLSALNVPVESQVLVFSKSSLNERLISPQVPRAIYFNDDVYVAWVPDAASLEISAVDRDKGAVFYTLVQQPQPMPALQREPRCLVCHVSSSTLDVPGHMLRSFETTETGKLLTGYSRVTHDTPYEHRWGGWYVTGKPSELPHLGNLAGESQFARHRKEPSYPGVVENLEGRFDTAAYLTATSDVVALLVLDHQVHFQNLCIRLGMESRLGLPTESTAKRLARYLLFADAPDLPAAVQGSSGYAAWFERHGTKEAAQEASQGTDTDRTVNRDRGRTQSTKRDHSSPDAASHPLRKLNLKDRVFEHRLSYLIDSAAFDGLTPQARQAVYRHVAELLLGDGSENLDWPADQRKATWALLLAVRDDVPDTLRRRVSGKRQILSPPPRP